MCFIIDRHAKRPTSRLVYKRLDVIEVHPNGRRRGISLKSPYFSSRPGGRDWRLGEPRSIAVGALTARRRHQSRPQAVEGLYVYATRTAALREYHHNGVIVACRVAPKDWLFSEWHGNARTYRKITPLRVVALGINLSAYERRKLTVRK